MSVEDAACTCQVFPEFQATTAPLSTMIPKVENDPVRAMEAVEDINGRRWNESSPKDGCLYLVPPHLDLLELPSRTLEPL